MYPAYIYPIYYTSRFGSELNWIWNELYSINNFILQKVDTSIQVVSVSTAEAFWLFSWLIVLWIFLMHIYCKCSEVSLSSLTLFLNLLFDDNSFKKSGSWQWWYKIDKVSKLSFYLFLLGDVVPHSVLSISSITMKFWYQYGYHIWSF